MKPIHFIYEVTENCNADCIFCYNIWKGKKKSETSELTLSEVKILFSNLINDTAIPEMAGVTLAGGEPLLRADLVDIASYLHTLQIQVGVATNGILLDAERIKNLLASGVNYFEVSLPSTDPNIYKGLTCQDHSSTVRNALLELNSADVAFTISTIITAKNWHTIADIIELAAAFGACAVSLNRFVPGGEGHSNKEQLYLSDQQLIAALDAAEKTFNKTDIPIAVTIPVEPCKFPHNRWPSLDFTPCRCGEEKWIISPAGELRTCEQNPDSLGNLLNEPFSFLSQKSAATTFREKKSPNKKCQTCQEIISCNGGCRFL